ncbi:HpcH/HpaI aldolase/citrate lyase family protein [Tunturiibacter gelidoferens]|uniref:CoA ester lyase n=1 Tax=Tunturiibacter gelidiferens TaxID=3069689 RepID=A0AAU7Z4H4_9BACT
MMRSKLFVPAIRPELFEKATKSGADAVCFDLEDSVAPARKVEARDHLQSYLRERQSIDQPLLLVRTNPVASADFEQDVDCAVWKSISAIVLPKVESAEDVCASADIIAKFERSRSLPTPLGILPTIESPRGLRFAAEIALSSPRVLGLQIGFADLLEPLGVAQSNVAARNQIRLTLRLAAAEAHLDCYDSAYANFKDMSGYEDELRASRSLGFVGASCIHPSQIPIVNRVFVATSEELVSAARILEAAEQAAQKGVAVTSIDGAMIDAPFIRRARKLLGKKDY